MEVMGLMLGEFVDEYTVRCLGTWLDAVLCFVPICFMNYGLQRTPLLTLQLLTDAI